MIRAEWQRRSPKAFYRHPNIHRPVTIQQAMDLALQHHQSGRLSEAEGIYRQILAVQPRQPDALHYLGLIAHQTGRNDFAVQLIRQALALSPHIPHFYCTLGEVYRALGQFDKAIGAYRQAIALKSNFAEAHGNLGNCLRGKGQIDEAIASYRQALALNPNLAETHSNLGNALREKGQMDAAIASYRQAIVLKADFAEAHGNLASALYDQGQLDEAIILCHQAIALKPAYPEAHYILGKGLLGKGHVEAAIASYRQAIVLKPGYAEAHGNLGNVLLHQKQLDEAIACFRKAVALKPTWAEIHYHLGNALRENRQSNEAVASYRKAIALKSAYGKAHNNLGNALWDVGQLDAATVSYRQAIAVDPGLAEAHSNLGNALRNQGLLDEAIAACRQAIALKPDFAEAHCNLGGVLHDIGLLDEAVAAFRQAIALQSDYGDAHSNLAIALLEQDDFAQGWPEYEWRFKIKENTPVRRNFTQPQWNGQLLAGRTILLHAEHGFGDALHFIRYAPLVAERGGRVIVECQAELQTLLASVSGISQIIKLGEPLPTFDFHCPLMSLPLAFDTRMETIPARIPYLRVDDQKASFWRERLSQEEGNSSGPGLAPSQRLKVGLVWAGGAHGQEPDALRIDRRRSMMLSQFAPIAGVSSVIFVSLQKGMAAEQTPPQGMTLLNWTHQLYDFADTAALVQALDLIISVDTSVVHLAGALGKPVWLLNRFDTCWRWHAHREDSPWYPTMRLFRQPAFGDWDTVIAEVRGQLEILAEEFQRGGATSEKYWPPPTVEAPRHPSVGSAV